VLSYRAAPSAPSSGTPAVAARAGHQHSATPGRPFQGIGDVHRTKQQPIHLDLRVRPPPEAEGAGQAALGGLLGDPEGSARRVVHGPHMHRHQHGRATPVTGPLAPVPRTGPFRRTHGIAPAEGTCRPHHRDE
jgi:hypothetical protein